MKYLDELAPDAREAVSAAEAEALAMGYDRVGTEHLLLGVLCGETTEAATMLTEAGATLAAARHKVREAMPPAPAGEISPPLPSTARGDRALGRAVRLSHQQRANAVTSEHLLWGVLDVEGTAGQVLRRLGVDVDRLRTALEIPESASTAAPDAPALALALTTQLSCPSSERISCQPPVPGDRSCGRAWTASGDRVLVQYMHPPAGGDLRVNLHARARAH